MKRLLQSKIAVLVLAVAFWLPAGGSAFEAFLWLDGIPGDAATAPHQDWIEVLGVTNVLLRWQLPVPPAPPVSSELTILKPLDKASPLLMLSCAHGTNISSAKLEFVTTATNGLKFYQIVLSNVVVKSLNSADAVNSLPGAAAEQCTLLFERIAWTYTIASASSLLPRTNLTSFWNLSADLGGSLSNAIVFKVTGIQKEPNQVVLSWPGEEGKTYQVFSSSSVEGPYRFLGEVVADPTAPVTTYAAPLLGSALFFTVLEKL